MKLKLATILFALSVVVSTTSCNTEEGLGQGQLPPLAGDVDLTEVLATDGTRVSPNYVLGVELGTAGASKEGSGAVLDVKFASAAPTLQAGAYTEASEAYAAAGNYITGAEGTKLYLNGEEHLVTAGTINVAVQDATYTIEGIVKLSNGENYRISWTGTGLAWNDLPQLKVLNTVMSAQSNIANGQKSITLNLSDGNFTSEMDMTTYQTVYKGAGNYLAIDLYSEDGYLAAGTYSPSAAGGAINKGEYGIGWDPGDIYNIGMAFENWGTCWWTVDENANPQTSAQKITEGNITVALAGNVYTITVDNSDIYAQFVGEIPAVTKPAEPADPWEISGSIVFEHSEGLSYTMVDDTANNTQADGSTALSGVTLYFVEVKDAAGNNVAILDLVTKEGATSIAGEYKVTSYPDEVGEAGNGFDLNFPEWGLVMSGGTILYGPDGTAYVIDAETSKVKVTENKGQTTIIVKGTSNGATIAGKYVIGEIQEDEGGEGEGGACGCDCDGCKDCTGGHEGGDDEGEDSFNGIELTQLLSAAEQYDAYKQMVLQFGTDGVSYDAATYSYKGTGTVINLTIHAEKGDSGVYLPLGDYVAADSTTEPFTWQVTGGMPEYNFYWGTLMYDVVDGTPTMTECTEGTVTVEEGSITFVLGGMRYRYVGQIPVI